MISVLRNKTLVVSALAILLSFAGKSRVTAQTAAACKPSDGGTCASEAGGDRNDKKAASAADAIPSLLYSARQQDNDDEQNARKAKDFSEYFSAYGELHHQKDMLTDAHRMDSYYTAISANAEAAFAGKVVLDVGTGSGILAVWAAKAGAKKVYAIEYTGMAENARKLAEANGVGDVVTVLRGTVEGIRLPLEEDGLLGDDSGGEGASERVVDVIVSEWMGYVLLRESMLDSVLVARDRYLRRDTGLMFPSHATVLIAPISDESRRTERLADYEDSMADWHDFVDQTYEDYGGVDYSVLTRDFDREQKEWYLTQGEWRELGRSHMVAEPQVLKTLDLTTCTHEDTRGIFSENSGSGSHGNVDTNAFDFVIDPKGPYNNGSGGITLAVSGLAVWFTTDFRSRTDPLASREAPVLSTPVKLDTGPEQGYTHWGQQAFYFKDPVLVPNDEAGTHTTYRLKGSLEMFRARDNTRMYKCRIKHSGEETENETAEVIGKTRLVEAVYSVP
ncbi:unnamed protein product [Pseudo-nitzschia multistriata]|uniref:Protein arginine N-methyltransferase domain-containing protein n=1 Tax=Pseudo-nitzschia multistriata TaxID=183589 RepID=A0A448ZL04_9STRA|nr:unnamed protein product [Pseudo-nitzschia multistriata]